MFGLFRRNAEKVSPVPEITEQERLRLEREAQKARKERERAQKIAEDHKLFEAYAPEIARLFAEYPEVLDWKGDSMSLLWVMVKRKEDKRPFSILGRIVLDDKGDILRFEERGGNIVFKEMSPSLPTELRKNQLLGLLRDSIDMSRYCEQVSATMLEEGECVFNAPYGLKANDTEYMNRYGSEEWVAAWILALKEEFQSRAVVSEGKGLFRMEAM